MLYKNKERNFTQLHNKRFSLQVNIRTFFTPLQPSVKQWTNGVSYTEIAPVESLKPYIYCYWELKTTEKLAQPYTYRVVADGCIDIFFDMLQPRESFVMGFCKQFTEFELEPEFYYVGIRFFPTIFPQIYKVNATELSNREQPLSQVSQETAAFIMQNFPSNNAIDLVLNNYFQELINKVEFDLDKRLYNALGLILEAGGNINIDEDIDTGISARQLRRIFEFYIGDTPKAFAKVVRFQRALKSRAAIKNAKGNVVHFDEGYYDQGHFIKDFKKYYGLTPGKAH